MELSKEEAFIFAEYEYMYDKRPRLVDDIVGHLQVGTGLAFIACGTSIIGHKVGDALISPIGPAAEVAVQSSATVALGVGVLAIVGAGAKLRERRSLDRAFQNKYRQTN